MSSPLPESTRAAGLGRLAAPVQWLVLGALSLAVTIPLELLGFPAALLIGPMIAGIAVGLSGGTIRLHGVFFFLVQVVLALMIAASVSRDFIGTFVANWPLMLFVVLSVIGVSTLSGWTIARSGILPGTTAIWGSSAGAASTMMAMAEAYGADVRLVAFMQYLRVVFVASIATLVARFGGHGGAGMPAHGLLDPVPLLPLAEALAVGLAAGFAGQRLRIPAGAFLLPFAVASMLNLSGTVHIELPQGLLAAAFALLGWTIGLRFTRAILLLGIDPMTAYLATSPGGLDSIAVIAASSKVDAAFVMALQTARLVVVTIAGPALARFVADRA